MYSYSLWYEVPSTEKSNWRIDSCGLDSFALHLKSCVGTFVRVEERVLLFVVGRSTLFGWITVGVGPVVGVIVLSVRLSGQCRSTGWGRAQILSSFTSDSGVR